MRASIICRFCEALIYEHPEVTVCERKGPCEACEAKLSKLIAAMPDPAITCGRVAPGGQGWCMKPAGHEVADAAGKADPSHVVVTYGDRISWQDDSLGVLGEVLRYHGGDSYKRFKFEIEVPKTLAPGEVSDLERWRRQIFAETDPEPVDLEVEIDGKPYLLKGLRPLGPPVIGLLDEEEEDEFVPPHERAGYPGDGPPVCVGQFTPRDIGEIYREAMAELERMGAEEAAAAAEAPEAFKRYAAQITACEALVAAVEADAPQGPEWWPELRVAYNTACRALGQEPKH